MAIDINNPLERQKWVKDGLLSKVVKSFWLPFTGNNSSAIIYQEIDARCSTGHNVVFDFSGHLTGKFHKGDVTYGKGEIKRKFSSTLAVDSLKLLVFNGTKFKNCAIDDLESTQHSNSISELGDLFIKQKDQLIFDTIQGALGQNPSHIYNLGSNFEYNDLLYISNNASKGDNLVGSDANGIVDDTVVPVTRSPINSFKSDGTMDMHLCVIDMYMAIKLKADPKYQTIVINADVRGNNNRSLSMVVGKLGNVIYVEAPAFFGSTEGKGAFNADDTEIEFSGLRRYAKLADGTIAWEGQVEFTKAYDLWRNRVAVPTTIEIYSRGALLGASAVQIAFGMMPDYELQEADFRASSESQLEAWLALKKTILTVERGIDYKGKVADIDYGTFAIDMKH